MQLSGEGGLLFGLAVELDGAESEPATRCRGTVWMQSAQSAKRPQIVTLEMPAAEMALAVRAIRNWPLELLEEMALRDQADRARKGRKPGDSIDTLDMEPGDE